MNPDEARARYLKVQNVLAEIDDMHTQENLDQLRAEAARDGRKLTGTLRGKSGFALKGADGDTISGITLYDVASLFARD